ncbi:MFS transporter [Streptomyces sp. WMMC500]|uniref:MFS transporter n=1 Tax=Streptomyces sp. WMMC500 TaxID=3015154 RepID=UPI00248B9A15|nr:MFS transporter [Streptomyces sp. WMMC500]WBB63478.1 MFS transporter [Streptomyces sp. WMMC500]
MASRRRWWALGGLVVSVLVLGFDLTILNVALPTMAADIGATTGELQWIVDAYAVVFAACMLPAGLLGDRFGRRRMLVAGLVIFLAGSLAGPFVSSPEAVIAVRTVMGLGGALIMPLALSVIPTLFGDEERATAVGAVTAGMAVGMPAGPLLGGWLLDHYWWGSVFVVNVPLVVLGIAAALLLIPETRDPSVPRVDPVSAVLSALGLGALVLGVIEGPTRGWDDPLVAGSLAGSAALLGRLALRERRATRPMLDLELLGDRAFRWNAIVAVLATFVVAGLLFLLPQYLQAVMGHDPFGTGLRLMPLMAGLLVAARAAPALMARYGSRTVVSAGMALFAFAMLLGIRTDAFDGYAFMAVWLSVTGLGLGCALVPTMDAALGALPSGRAGGGTGLLITLRQVGGAMGVALLGSLLNGVFTDRLDTEGVPEAAAEKARESVVAAHAVAERLGAPRLAESADAAYVDGMGQGLLVCGIAALLTAVVTAVRLPDGRGDQKRGAETPGRKPEAGRGAATAPAPRAAGR